MADQTNIEWCDRTFNPFIGCTKVSPGCDNCYAEKLMDHRMHKVLWGAGQARVRTSASNWNKPLMWNKQAEAFAAAHGRRQRVFCASLSDVFDNAVDPTWRQDLANLIQDTPNLDWLLLTKRIGNAGGMLGEMFLDGVPDNIWLGATIVNQEEADRDIPKLLRIPAARRFLSMEPLLGMVNLMPMFEHRAEFYHDTGVHWVIIGGESGPGARPMHPGWARSLRDQCAAAGVPFLFKQWGEWLPAVDGRSVTGKVLILNGAAPFTDNPQWHGFEDGQKVARVGKKAAGRLLDGVQHDGYPEAL